MERWVGSVVVVVVAAGTCWHCWCYDGCCCCLEYQTGQGGCYPPLAVYKQDCWAFVDAVADVLVPSVEIAEGDAESAAFDAAGVACVDDEDAVVDGIAGGDGALDFDVGADDGMDDEDVGDDDGVEDADRWEECFDGVQVDWDVVDAGGVDEDEVVVAFQEVDHSRACCCAVAAADVVA